MMRLWSPSLLIAVVLVAMVHAVLAYWLWQLKQAEPIKPIEIMSMQWIDERPEVAAQPPEETPPPAPIEPVEEPEPVLTKEVAPTPPPPPVEKLKPKPKPKPTPKPVEKPKVPVAEPVEASAPTQPAATQEVAASTPVKEQPLIQATADYLNNPKPSYPRASKRLGEEGEVRLRVQVSKGGQVLAVQLKRSSGYERLDKAAIESVQQWRFKPATRGDEALESWVEVPVKFVLE